MIEGVVFHVVVLNLTSATFIIDIVRRVGHDQICLLSVHQKFIGLRLCGVTTDKAMLTKEPQVTGLGKGRLCKLSIHIEVVILNIFFCIFSEQVLQFFRLKSGERDIEVSALQVRDKKGQLVVIPFTTDFVESNIQCFLFILIHFNNDAFHFRDAHVDEDF